MVSLDGQVKPGAYYDHLELLKIPKAGPLPGGASCSGWTQPVVFSRPLGESQGQPGVNHCRCLF